MVLKQLLNNRRTRTYYTSSPWTEMRLTTM